MNNEQKILACVDATPAAEGVAAYAAWAAVRLQAPLEFLHVLDRHKPLSAPHDHSGAIGLDAQEKLLTQLSTADELRTRAAREAGRLFLNRLRAHALAAGATPVDTRLRHGEVEETLSEQQAGTRLFVLGRAGASSSTGGAELGKHLEWVVRSVNLPVLVAAPVYAEPSRVLFAFDGSSVTRRGVAMLAASPLLKGLPIHLLMSGTTNAQAQAQLASAVQTLTDAGLPATFALVPGQPQEVIAAALKDPAFNLLVMGAYSHSPLRNLFVGSKTSELLRSARVATLLLR